jgi:hypothetical protein
VTRPAQHGVKLLKNGPHPAKATSNTKLVQGTPTFTNSSGGSQSEEQLALGEPSARAALLPRKQ